MTRARDLSNLGSQAGSGLDASDITSGILPVGVVGGSGLNAVNPANLASGVMPVGVTGGSGLNAVGAGNLASGVLPATVTGGSGLNAVNAANIAAGVLPVGVTGGSGLTAVNAANIASGVLPVGVTGGSGLTALGTVVSGNISHADIVYPAHHIVQVKSVITDFQLLVASSSGAVKTTLAGSITPKLLNSAMIISAYFVTYSASDSTAYFDLYRNSDDLTEVVILSGDTAKGMSIQGHPASSTWQTTSLFWYDDTTAMTSRNGVQDIEYALTAWTSTGGIYISNDSKTALVIMEVAV